MHLCDVLAVGGEGCRKGTSDVGFASLPSVTFGVLIAAEQRRAEADLELSTNSTRTQIRRGGSRLRLAPQ
jgi:hypothetical protein